MGISKEFLKPTGPASALPTPPRESVGLSDIPPDALTGAEITPKKRKRSAEDADTASLSKKRRKETTETSCTRSRSLSSTPSRRKKNDKARIENMPKQSIEKSQFMLGVSGAATYAPPTRQSTALSTVSRSVKVEPGIDDDFLPQYQYTPLPPGAIRLLTVNGGPKTDELHCKLTMHMLDKPKELKNMDKPCPPIQEYEALSYVWGDEEASETIRIDTDAEPAQLRITKGLLSALKHLRYQHKRRVFWVDAVCIHQNNDNEKNHQVPMMAKIYHEAVNVCVWLGESSDRSPLALALIKKIRFLRRYDKVVEEGTDCNEWDALIDLMKRKWFSRRWVVQEIALAKRASLHCGEYQILWSEFADAVALFKEMESRVRKKFKASEQHQHPSDFIGDVEALSASQLVTAVTNLVRKAEDKRVLKKLCTLECLVSRLTAFDAKSPHDIIYAVLSLAQDVNSFQPATNPEAKAPVSRPVTTEYYTKEEKVKLKRVTALWTVSRYPVDYSKSFYEVARDYLEFVTAQSSSLDMICRPWAPAESCKKLPSWIRSLKLQSHGNRSDGNRDRINADSLVGLPNENIYTASGKYPPSWKFVDEGDVHSLVIKGFLLDTVAKTRESALSGTLPRSWQKCGGWADSQQPPPEEFWRTLVADRDPHGKECPSYYAKACEEAFKEKIEGGDMETSKMITTINSSLMEQFIKRMQAVIFGRRMIRTQAHNFLGLAPSEPKKTRKGDLICILLGCSVPVVLRKNGLNEQTGKPHYRLVGETYIHGMMDGDAFKIKNEDKTEFQDFEIR